MGMFGCELTVLALFLSDAASRNTVTAGTPLRPTIMNTNPPDSLPSTVEGTLAVCPRCVPFNHGPLDLA